MIFKAGRRRKARRFWRNPAAKCGFSYETTMKDATGLDSKLLTHQSGWEGSASALFARWDGFACKTSGAKSPTLATI
jgi:hypothetical protein